MSTEEMKYVLSRDGSEKGIIVLGSRHCNCCGKQNKIRVRWPDGRHTWPCVRGLKIKNQYTYQII